MKRLDRLGSVAFATVMFSFVFHLLGMSYKNWIHSTCKTCNKRDPLALLDVSLHERCYEASLAEIFLQANATPNDGTFRTSLCIPNQYLFAKDLKYANYCLGQAETEPDTVCIQNLYNKGYCRCDYTLRTKIALAMTVIAALSLGVMVFFSHLISFVKIDYILNWLIPVCFVLLLLSMICLIVAISVMGVLSTEDIMELNYQWSLFKSTLTDVRLIENYKDQMLQSMNTNYTIYISWCLGLEILSLYFCTVSLVLYGLMFHAKRRPEPEPKHHSEPKQQIELQQRSNGKK